MIFGQSKEGAEESLVSEGLKEAINSYLYMTEECEDCCQLWETWQDDRSETLRTSVWMTLDSWCWDLGWHTFIHKDTDPETKNYPKNASKRLFSFVYFFEEMRKNCLRAKAASGEAPGRWSALTHCCSSRVGDAGDKAVTVSCVQSLLADMKENMTEGKNERSVCVGGGTQLGGVRIHFHASHTFWNFIIHLHVTNIIAIIEWWDP